MTKPLSEGYSWLQKPEVQRLIDQHVDDDPSKLLLKWHKDGIENSKQLIEQIISKKKARSKIPFFLRQGVVLPPPLSIEQSSSAETAGFKSDLFSGKTCVDLTGGAGIDTLFLANSFMDTHYVERETWLCDIAKNNFKVHAAMNIQVHCGEAETFNIEKGVDLVYVDPARRRNDKKVAGFEDSEPDILPLIDKWLQTANHILIKASPMIDIDMAVNQLQHVHRVYVVAVSNEVREVLFHLKKEPGELEITARDLKQDVEMTFSADDEKITPEWKVPEDGVLYIPNRSITKAGAFNTVANRWGLCKLGPQTHVYSNEDAVPFPGRAFRIVEVLKGKKAIHGKAVDVIAKNFQLTADQFRKQYHIQPGDGKQFIIAAGRNRSSRVYLCEKLE